MSPVDFENQCIQVHLNSTPILQFTNYMQTIYKQFTNSFSKQKTYSMFLYYLTEKYQDEI